MEFESGIASAFTAGVESLQAYGAGMGVCAHNIANVSTAGFKARRAMYQTGPAGMGVRMEPESRPAEDSLPDIFRDSGTELAVEMPRLLETSNAFKAGAAIVRCADQLTGTVLDIKS